MMIRHAGSGDSASIIALINQLGYEISREDLSANLHMYEKVQGFVFVAEENGKVIGFVSGLFIPLFHKHELMFRVSALCVDENEREEGIGKRLLEKIEELCRKKEC